MNSSPPPFGTLLIVAVAIGAIDAVAFVVFEYVVNDGSDWLWNDLIHTDDDRWRVVPLAIALSIGFSLLVRLTRQSRWQEPRTDLLEEGGPPPTATLGTIAVIFVVGAASLLAGASLGPEASLMALSVAVGAWLAQRVRAGAASSSLVFGSVGALLVAFVGSLIPLVIAPLLLRKQGLATMRHVSLTVIAGLAAFGTLFVARGGSTEGYGTIPVANDLALRDVLTALVLGFVAVFVARGFDGCVRVLMPVTKRIDTRVPWAVSAGLFGAVLGLIYLAGGDSIEFSGSVGTTTLLQRAATYSALGLFGLALAKLVATAWSLSTGYRGGVVFPSIFTAVAAGLFVSRVASSLAGPGVAIGVVAGILTALTGAAFALVFMLSLLPIGLAVLAFAGAAGAVLSDRMLTKVSTRKV